MAERRRVAAAIVVVGGREAGDERLVGPGVGRERVVVVAHVEAAGGRRGHGDGLRGRFGCEGDVRRVEAVHRRPAVVRTSGRVGREGRHG